MRTVPRTRTQAPRVRRDRYRAITIRMWGDEKFGSLSSAPPNGQTLWVYFLIGPHTGIIPGLFVVGVAALAEALEWLFDDCRRVVDEILMTGMARYDAKARLWWLPRAIRHNPPQSPSVVTAWRRAFVQLPECPLRQEAEVGIIACLRNMGPGYRRAWSQPHWQPARQPAGQPDEQAEAHQEQDQDQECVVDLGGEVNAGAPESADESSQPQKADAVDVRPVRPGPKPPPSPAKARRHGLAHGPGGEEAEAMRSEPIQRPPVKLGREDRNGHSPKGHSPKEPRGRLETAELARVLARWSACFERHHSGIAPHIRPFDRGVLLRLLRERREIGEVLELVELFFERPPKWIRDRDAFTPDGFVRSYTELLVMRERTSKA